MQTLIPQPVIVRARYLGRAGRVVGFGLSAKALLLLIAGVLWAMPAFFHPHRLWMMLAWDGLITLLLVVDAMGLPSPSAIAVTRRFLNSPQLGDPTDVEYEVVQESRRIVEVRLTDDLHTALLATPRTLTLVAYPRDAVRSVLKIIPVSVAISDWARYIFVIEARAACGTVGCLRCGTESARVSSLRAERR